MAIFSFFQKSAFGLDISDTSLEMVEFQKKGGRVILSAVGRMILAKGSDRGRENFDEAKLAAAIKDFCSKDPAAKNFHQSGDRLSYPNQKFSRTISNCPSRLKKAIWPAL